MYRGVYPWCVLGGGTFDKICIDRDLIWASEWLEYA